MVFLFCAQAAKATIWYWSGGSGISDNIDQNGNWFAAGNPSPGDDLYFNNTTGSHYPYDDYVLSYFGNLIAYSGAGYIEWKGNNTYLYKFENNNSSSLFQSLATLENRTGPDYDLQINPVGSGGVEVNNVIMQNGKQLQVYGNYTLTIDGVISQSGSGNATMAIGLGGNTPTVILKSANTFNGGTYVVGGTLRAMVSGALQYSQVYLGETSGSTDASLNLDGGITWNGQPLTVRSGSSGVKTIANTSGTSGTAYFNNKITLNDNLRLYANSGGGLSVSTGPIDFAANTTLTVDGPGSTTISCVMENAGGTGVLTKQGSGLLTLSAANTFTGGVNINGGTVQVNATETAGTSGPLGKSGTIALGGGVLRYSSADTYDYSSRFSTGASQAYNIDVNGQNVTFLTALNSSGGELTLSDTASGGKLTLTAANNTYSGGTTLNGGTLSVSVIADSGSSQIGTSGGVTLGGGGLQYTGSGLATTSRSFTGTGGTTSTIDLPSGGLTLNGAVSGSSAFTVNKTSAGVLTLGGTSDNAFLQMDVFGGTVVLNKSSSSSVHAIGGNNGTVESGATLQLSGSGGDQIADSAAITVKSGGAFDLGGKSETIYALSIAGTGTGGGGALANSSGTASTLTVNNQSTLAGAASIGGNNGDITIAGNGALTAGSPTTVTKIGSDTLTLSSGGNVDNLNLLLQVNAGTVVLNKTSTGSGGAHAVGGLTINSGGTVKLAGTGGYEIYEGATPTVNSGGVLDMNGQNQTFTSAGPTISGTGISSSGALINSSGSASLTSKLVLGGDSSVGGSGNLTITDVISGGNSLTKVGGGALTLSGANTFGGSGKNLTLSTGVLNLNNASAVGNSANTLIISGGTIDNTSGNAITLANNYAEQWNGDFTFTGSSSLNLAAGAVTLSASRQVTVNANTLTVGGNISGNTFNLTKTGAGTLVLNGNITTTSGNVTENGGVLTLAGANTYSGGTTLSAGQLNINSTTALGATAGAFTISGGTIDNTSAGDITLANNNTQNWNSDFTYAGSVHNLNLGTGAVAMNASRQVTVSANTLTVGGAISGTGFGLTKAGAGTVVLSGSSANTYSGATTVNVGELDLNKTPGVDAIAGALVVGDGTGGANADVVKLLAANQINDGSAITINSSGKLDLNGNNETIASLAGSGNVTLGSGLLTAGNANNTTFSGVISGTGAFTKQGTGTLTLSGANTYSGDTTISAGQLKLGASDVLPDGSGKGNVVLSGTLNLAGFSDTINGLSGAGTVDNTTGNGVLTVGGNNQTSTFDGLIKNTSGTLTLTKTGSGTLTLTAANTYSGLTSVSNGTLVVANTTGSGTGSGYLLVVNGATLSMQNGLISGTTLTNFGTVINFGTINSTLVNSGAVFAVTNGANIGTLTVSEASTTNGSTATIGTIGTNAVLDLSMPGGASQPLINLGTISMGGGTLLANGTSTGTISNQSTGFVTGVGNVTQTVVNNGTIMAANPVSGLSVFSVGLSDLNSATIGASNGATLNVVISGGTGSSFNNNGSISMIGGTLIISNATPGSITNMANAFVTGVGTVMPNIVNLNNGTIQATVSGGILDVSLSATNSGYLGAGSGATLTFENSSFVNAGTIGAVGGVGGTIQMASSSGVITNRGTITGIGNLNINGFVQNDAVGRIMTTNGILSFNAINGLKNQGTIDIANGGTFQSNSSNSWVNAGMIDMRGGTLRTGGTNDALVSAIFTNTGTIDGFGMIIGGGAQGGSGSGYDKSIANLGTIIATNPLGTAAATLTIDTGNATVANGIQNLGNMIIASNNTLVLNRANNLALLNTGTITINNGNLIGSSVISNDLNGIIQGYGTLSNAIVNAAGGTIRATNGLLVMTSAVNPINYGTMQVAAGATLTWNATNSWLNSGTIDMRGGTLRTGGTTNTPPIGGPYPGEPFTNANYIVGSGTIIGGGAFGGAAAGYDKSILNLGTVTASGGTLTLNTGFATANQGLANKGTMIIATANDTLVLERQAEITPTVTNLNYIYNSGTILLNGGTFTSNTSITNAYESPSLPGLIQGFGIINLTNQLVNLGTIRSTNSVAGGNGILYFVNPGNILNIQQSGTLDVELGSQMIFGSDSNAVVANASTIVMDGGYLRSGTLTNQSAANISGFGTITSPLENLNVTMAANGNLQLTGRVSGNGAYRAVAGSTAATLTFAGGGSISALYDTGATIRVASTLTNASVFVNEGSLAMAGGTYYSAANVTNASGNWISGSGTIAANVINQSGATILASGTALTFSGSYLVNQAGSVLTNNNAQLTVSSIFTNAGTVSFVTSVGTFSSAVVNSGAWVTASSSKNVFLGNYTVAPNGYITMTSGDVMVFSNGSNFANTSTLSNQYDTLNGKFLFDGGGNQTFAVAGIDMLGSNLTAVGTISQTNAYTGGSGTPILGFTNNFALGTLEVGNSGTLTLNDAFLADGHTAGLYLDNLILDPGATLIVNSGVEVYYKGTNGSQVLDITLGAGSGGNVIVLDGGSFHQLIVPEPSILMLLVMGGLGIYWRRRRAR